MAAKIANFQFIGQSGATYSKAVYLSDVAAVLGKWADGTGAPGATAADNWQPDENVLLVDVAVPTGMATATHVEMMRNGLSTGDLLGIGAHLDTSSGRPKLTIAFVAGKKVQCIQR